MTFKSELDEKLISTYRNRRRAGNVAWLALKDARETIAAGRQLYWSPYGSTWGNKVSDDGAVWIEDYKAAGLRFVGFADEIVRSIGHTGWYTDVDGFESIRGAVFLLPGRNKAQVCLAGYLDPYNDGAARVCVSPIIGEPGDNGEGYGHYTDVIHDAANQADSFTENVATQERDYNTAWQAGASWQSLKDELRALRDDIREAIERARNAANVIRETADEKAKALATDYARIARRDICGLRSDRARIWAKMRKLADGESNGLIFYPGDKDLKGAFNDGAGESVI